MLQGATAPSEGFGRGNSIFRGWDGGEGCSSSVAARARGLEGAMCIGVGGGQSSDGGLSHDGRRREGYREFQLDYARYSRVIVLVPG